MLDTNKENSSTDITTWGVYVLAALVGVGVASFAGMLFVDNKNIAIAEIGALTALIASLYMHSSKKPTSVKEKIRNKLVAFLSGMLLTVITQYVELHPKLTH